MNAAQRVEKAMRRVEEASTKLLAAASIYGTATRNTYHDQQHALDVHEYARHYAAAMRALTRVSRSTP